MLKSVYYKALLCCRPVFRVIGLIPGSIVNVKYSKVLLFIIILSMLYLHLRLRPNISIRAIRIVYIKNFLALVVVDLQKVKFRQNQIKGGL